MAKTMNQDIEAIRHYAGTVADFKNFFDQKAAETANKDKENTNAYGTPEYQGFNDVHPTRGANASPHWEESVTEDVEVTQEMWDKEWKIRKTFGKEYDEHFAKRIEAAMSKAKDGEMAENWAFINWKQLPGKADGMTIKESLNEAVGIGTIAAAAIGAGILFRLGLMSDAKLQKTIDTAKGSAKEAGKALKMAGTALARELPIIGKKIKKKELTAWQLKEIQKYVNDEVSDKDVIESLSQDPELKKIIDDIATGSSSYRKFYDHIKRIKGSPWANLDKKFIDLRKKLKAGEIEESNSNTNAVDRLPLFEDFQG